MDFLLSWSGHASHEIATFLRTWLPDVLPGCKPWVSSEDIAKGKPWRDELHGLLGRAKVSIVVITPDNLRLPWLYYEAGWIAAKMEATLVRPYLVGVPMKLVTGRPLADFQCTEADKTDTLRLIRSLHAAVGEPHPPALLEGNYKSRWPQLKNKIERVAEGFTVEEDPVTQVELPLASLSTPEAKRLLLSRLR